MYHRAVARGGHAWAALSLRCPRHLRSVARLGTAMSSGSEQRMRTMAVRVRCTPEEHATIAHKANECGRSVSEFVRAAALGRRVTPAVPNDVRIGIGNLGRLGGLLKQIIVRVDGGQLPAELATEARSAIDVLRRLGLELLERL